MKTYLWACYTAITAGWRNGFKDDSVTGNCFTILWYGVTACAKESLYFIVRFLMLVTFPLTAFLIISSDKKRKIREEEAIKEANLDL